MPYEPDALRLWRRADALGVPRSVLADLSAGVVSSAKISRVTNGAEEFSYIEDKKLDELLTDLEVLQLRANGVPVNWSNRSILRDLLAELQREKNAPPPPPPSLEDLQIISKLTNGTAPADLAAELNVTVSQLLQRLSEISTRIQYVTNEVHQIVTDRRALMAASRADHEARKLEIQGQQKF